MQNRKYKKKIGEKIKDKKLRLKQRKKNKNKF